MASTWGTNTWGSNEWQDDVITVSLSSPGATTALGVGSGENQRVNLSVSELFWEGLMSNDRAFTTYSAIDLTQEETNRVVAAGINMNTRYSQLLSRQFVQE